MMSIQRVSGPLACRFLEVGEMISAWIPSVAAFCRNGVPCARTCILGGGWCKYWPHLFEIWERCSISVFALRCARVAPSRTLATTATKRENILTFLPIIPDPFLPGWNGLAWVFMWRYFGKNKGGPKYASIAKMKAGNTIIWLAVAGLAVLFFASEWHGKDILEWVPLYNLKYTREKIPEMS